MRGRELQSKVGVCERWAAAFRTTGMPEFSSNGIGKTFATVKVNLEAIN